MAVSDSYRKSEKAALAMRKDLRKRGFNQKMVRAAMGGWEWAMEQMHDHKNDRYDVDKMDGDGSDAAYDLAEGLVVCGDIPANKRESFADYVYEGIKYARDYVRETYNNGEDQR